MVVCVIVDCCAPYGFVVAVVFVCFCGWLFVNSVVHFIHIYVVCHLFGFVNFV